MVASKKSESAGDHPRYSVIVPAYQAQATLPRCLAGLDAQTMPQDDFEILVVDNNSTDETSRIALRHGRARLLRETEQGAYAARNRALAHARGEVFAFTDPDCVPDPDWLEQIEEALLDPGVMVAVGPADAAGSSVSLDLLSKYERHKDAYALGSNKPRIYYGHTNNMAVRREVFQTLGGFLRLGRGADTVLVRQAVDRFGCGSVLYAPRIRVRHLEIDTVETYFQKVKTYAASCRRYSGIVDARPLTTLERLRVFRKIVAEEGLSATRAVHLMMLLLIGIIHWHAGGFQKPPKAAPAPLRKGV